MAGLPWPCPPVLRRPGCIPAPGTRKRCAQWDGIRQATLAGAVAGAVGGLVLTVIGPVAVVMMIMGPLAGATGGALSGTIVADHPRARTGDRALPAVIAGEAVPD